MTNPDPLSTLVDTYGVPDQKIVAKLPRGGINLDYVGHAEITRILLQIDPYWTIEPVAYDDNGLPAVRSNGRMVEAAFWLTLCGHRRYCIGSVETRKADGDLGKELISDAIRNGAMRFGIALSLWAKDEWTDNTGLAPKPSKKAATTFSKVQRAADTSLTELVARFEEKCRAVGFEPDEIADRAGVDLNNITQEGMDKLRAAYKEAIK